MNVISLISVAVFFSTIVPIILLQIHENALHIERSEYSFESFGNIKVVAISRTGTISTSMPTIYQIK